MIRRPATVFLTVLLATAVLIATAGSGIAAAQSASGGYKTVKTLGGPSRVTPAMRDEAALKKMFANKAHQRSISQILDKAGLTNITPQVMTALTQGPVTSTSFAPGGTMEWMGFKRGGKADVMRMVRWGGAKPFDGFAFDVDTGERLYSFVIPKACGNLSLVKSGPSPALAKKDDAARLEQQQQQQRQDEQRRAEQQKRQDEQRRAEEQKRADEQKRQDETRLKTPVACSATAIATRVSGGWQVDVDGSASGSGQVAAKAATFEVFGPDGKAVSFEQAGKPGTSGRVEAPSWKTNFLIRRAKTGTYTIKAKTEPLDPRGTPNACQTTFVIAETDMMDWFVDGAFGKQRRNYEVQQSPTSNVTVEPGFCDPMIGFKAGPLFWFSNSRASFAPAAGMAFMFGDLGDYDFGDNEYNNVSFLLEAVVNYHFSERGAYIGTGLGWWDVFDGNHNTANWIVNFGVPIQERLYFIGEGRLFFDSPDGASNNYQMWGGLRFLFR